MLDRVKVSEQFTKVSFSWIPQVMSEDLIPDKMREDYQDGESLASVCIQSFTERWWNKILVTGVLETDGCQRQTESPDAVYREEGRRNGTPADGLVTTHI